MPSDKLPPIDFTEDITKYEAKAITADTNKPRCNHKQIKWVNGQLVCTCGVAYSGARLDELYKLLTS